MHHVFRVNVAGRGYGLFAGDPRTGFRPRPLGVTSDGVSADAVAALDRLDAVLESRQVPVSVCLRRPVVGPVVVSYGTRVHESDEYGRSGLLFAHAFEVSDPGHLYAGVAAVVTALAAGPGRVLFGDVRDLARGKPGVAAADVLRRTAERVEAAFDRLRDLRPPAGGDPPAAIRHDCAGAPVLAWLSSAAAQLAAPPPWEVYEQVGPDGDLETRLEPAAGTRTTASTILWRTTEPAPGVVATPVPPTPPLPRWRAAVPWLVAGVLLATSAALALRPVTTDSQLLAELDTANALGAESAAHKERADRLSAELLAADARLATQKQGDADRVREALAELARQKVKFDDGQKNLLAERDALKQSVGVRDQKIQELTQHAAKAAEGEKKSRDESAQLTAKAAETEKNLHAELARQGGTVTTWKNGYTRLLNQLIWYSVILKLERVEHRRVLDARSRAVSAMEGVTAQAATFESKYVLRLLKSDRAPGQPLAEVLHAKKVTSAAFDAGQNWLVSGDAAGGRSAYDLRKMVARKLAADDPNAVSAVAAREDGALLFAHGGAVYSSAAGEAVNPLIKYDDSIMTALHWVPRGDVYYGYGHTIREPRQVVYAEGGLPPKSDPKPRQTYEAGYTAVGSQPGGRYAAYAQGKTFEVYDSKRAKPYLGTGECAATIKHLEFDPKEERLVCTVGNSIELWSLDTPPKKEAVLSANSLVTLLRFTPDGSRLVTCHLDGTAVLWDATTGRLVLPLGRSPNDKEVLAVSLGDDGRILTCSRTDNRLQLWEGLPIPAGAPPK